MTKRKITPFSIGNHLKNFIPSKTDYRERFKCVQYTGEYGVATNTHIAVIFPSTIPPMFQNYYTQELGKDKFPDLFKLIPTEFVYEAELTYSQVIDLNSAASCAIAYWGKDEYKQIRLMFYDGGVEVKFNKDHVTASVCVECADVKGKFHIPLSAKYLNSALSLALDYLKLSGKVKFQFQGLQQLIMVTIRDIRILITPHRDYIN